MDTVAIAVAEWKRRGGTLLFDGGRSYDFGTIDDGTVLFDVRGLRRAAIDGAGARFSCRTRSGRTRMFMIRDCQGIELRNIHGIDRGARLDREWVGMDFIYIYGAEAGSSDIVIDRCTAESAVSFLSCAGRHAVQRIQRVRVRNSVARSCYYALSFQENGDDVDAQLTVSDCRRAYFPYGVARHQIALDIASSGMVPAANALIMIARMERDTRDIAVRATLVGVVHWGNVVMIQNLASGEPGFIGDVAIELDIDPAARIRQTSSVMRISSAQPGGGLRRQARHQWGNISLSGNYAILGDVALRSDLLSSATPRVALRSGGAVTRWVTPLSQ
jgi:hypothetical protein